MMGPSAVLDVRRRQGAGAGDRLTSFYPPALVSGRVSSLFSFRAARRRQAGSVCVLKQPRPGQGGLAFHPRRVSRSASRRGFAPTRLGRCPLAPKATQVLRCHEASLCAIRRREQVQHSGIRRRVRVVSRVRDIP
jgi:hypothetical protein